MNARIPDDALPPTLDPKALQAFVDDKWDNEIIPALTDYIAVPARARPLTPTGKRTPSSSAWCATRRSGSRRRRSPA